MDVPGEWVNTKGWRAASVRAMRQPVQLQRSSRIICTLMTYDRAHWLPTPATLLAARVPGSV